MFLFGIINLIEFLISIHLPGWMVMVNAYSFYGGSVEVSGQNIRSSVHCKLHLCVG